MLRKTEGLMRFGAATGFDRRDGSSRPALEALAVRQGGEL